MASPHPSRDWVALVLAIGIAAAINIITLAVLWDALFNENPGLSESSTQLLTAAFGGIIGVLGSYLGYRAGFARGRREPGGEDSGHRAGGGDNDGPG